MQHLIVGLDRLLVVALLELNISQVKIAISSQIGVGIILYVVAEFLNCQIVLARLVVAQRIVVKNIRRWDLSLLLLL